MPWGAFCGSSRWRPRWGGGSPQAHRNSSSYDQPFENRWLGGPSWEFRSVPRCALSWQRSPPTHWISPSYDQTLKSLWPQFHFGTFRSTLVFARITRSRPMPLRKIWAARMPHSKVINHPTLHSLYHNTSLICINMHIHDALISLLRRTARLSVVTEAINLFIRSVG